MGERGRRDGSDAGGGERGGESKPPASRWEWVIGGLSALLVLGILAFMIYDGVVRPESPPRLEVRVDSLHAAARGGYLVEFRIRNTGQSTAAAVLVEGELVADTGTVERGQVTIDYVPGGSERRAGLIFSNDPRRHSLRIHPKGYDTP